MKTIKKISEDEMIAEFLKAEIDSSRYGKDIKSRIKEDSKPKRIISYPNITSEEENFYRKKLLGVVRGYSENKFLFQNFPKETQWKIAIMSKKELKKIRYINNVYWNVLSNESRLPTKAAKNVKAGIKACGESNKIFYEILAEIKREKRFPLMILVAKNKKSKIVVMEGHARLTAYFLESKYLPKEMKVIIGYSNEMDRWKFY